MLMEVIDQGARLRIKDLLYLNFWFLKTFSKTSCRFKIKMTFKSAEEIFIFYDSELDCMEIWDFALKYSPMTDDVRNRILSQSIPDNPISNI